MPTKYKSFEKVLDEALAQDPMLKADWDRTEVPRSLAIFLIKYRTVWKLTPRELGERLGWARSAVVRTEDGEHVPTIDTLRHVCRTLGATFRIDIDPTGKASLTDLTDGLDITKMPDSTGPLLTEDEVPGD